MIVGQENLPRAWDLVFACNLSNYYRVALSPILIQTDEEKALQI